jgi:lipopolysaccharide transport system ATP-binding protein
LHDLTPVAESLRLGRLKASFASPARREITRNEVIMSEVLIKVENVSKRFCKSFRTSLRYAVYDMIKELNPFLSGGNEKPALRKNEFWAVDGISFELRRGECLGIVGHNGAGKSSLLKLLNGIIKPTMGRIEMKGRVAALIELSAGFDPILTGRENIYNKGAILGLSRAEVAGRFDSIVEFAELEDFIDMPVQNYSSGMKVRLGFALSVQIKPDILIVDEVLAVGDLGFVVKCFNKIGNILSDTAVIVVSHSMPSISRIASKILLIDHGKPRFLSSDVPKGIELYAKEFTDLDVVEQGSGEFSVNSLGIWSDEKKQYIHNNDICLINEHAAKFDLKLQVNSTIDESFYIRLMMRDRQQRNCLECISGINEADTCVVGKEMRFEIEVPNLILNTGKHSITVAVVGESTGRFYCRTENVIHFNILAAVHVSSSTSVVEGTWELS